MKHRSLAGRVYHHVQQLRLYQQEKYTNYILYVTNRCNLTCEHCFYNAELNHPLKEFTVDELKKMFEPIKGDCNSLILTGGEPFIRNDLFEVCKVLNESGVEYILIVTNGFFTDRVYDTVKKITEGLPDLSLAIQISLDGLCDTHSKIRQSRFSFDKLVATANKLKELPVDLTLKTFLSKSNFREIEEFAEYVDKNIGVQHSYDFVRGTETSGLPLTEAMSGFSPKDKSIFLDDNEIREAWKKLYSVYKKRGKGSLNKLFSAAGALTSLEVGAKTLLLRKSPGRCIAGDKMGVIYPNGDMGICELMKVVGNVRQENYDLKKVWHNENSERQRKHIDGCYCTHGCFQAYQYKPKFQQMLVKNIFRLALNGKPRVI